MGDHSLLTKLKVHTATVFRFYYVDVRLIKVNLVNADVAQG